MGIRRGTPIRAHPSDQTPEQNKIMFTFSPYLFNLPDKTVILTHQNKTTTNHILRNLVNAELSSRTQILANVPRSKTHVVIAPDIRIKNSLLPFFHHTTPPFS